VVGICGGYQMLGNVILDPQRVESNRTRVPGLELLNAQTEFHNQKSTYQARGLIQTGNGWFQTAAGQPVEGYEIHMGETNVNGKHWLEIVDRNGQSVHVLDGAANESGRVWGCYLHGIFDNDAFRHAWLESLGWKGRGMSHREQFEASLETLAERVEEALDMQKLEEMIWEN
jgi:adenosylcobyric acid synthase